VCKNLQHLACVYVCNNLPNNSLEVFVRPHQAIGGQTPAEAAGINLNLGENKVENLMRQAAIHAIEEERSLTEG